MSGVLHPVGPEPAQVYWIRRVLVLGSAVLMLVLVIAVVANLNSAASASGPEAVPAPVGSTSAPVVSDSAGASVAPPSGAAPSFSAAASSPSTTSAASTAGAKPSSSTTARSSAAARRTASANATTTPKSKATPAEVAACVPAQLRPTLTGKQSVKIKSKTDLDLSLINGSGKPCRLTLNSDNFVLTIYSGRDRIWSTADCTDLVKPTSVKIANEDAYEWRLVWDGRRSKASCKTRPEVPKAGTYVATAQFKGADPVKFRMFLHK